MNAALDSLSYTNRLRFLPPGQKMVFALVLLGLVSLGHWPLQVASAIWLSIWIIGYAKIPWKTYFKLVGAAMLFFAFSLPALVLQVDGGGQAMADSAAKLVLVQTDSMRIWISETGLERASGVFLRSLAAFVCLSFLLFTVPFAEMMQTLRRWRVPALVTELLMVMYRFVFVLLESAIQIRQAQLARGGYNGIRPAIRDAGKLVQKLVVRMMEHYRQLSIGLAARGFQGELTVCSREQHRRSVRLEREAVAGLLLLIGLELATGGGR